jgi:hypothetical protein
MQDMIESLKTTCPLIGGKVAGILYNHDCTFVTPRIFADRADLLIGEILADPAESHMRLCIADCICKAVHACRGHPYDMKGKTLRGLVADTGQRSELVDQLINVAGI